MDIAMLNTLIRNTTLKLKHKEVVRLVKNKCFQTQEGKKPIVSKEL